MKSTFYFFLSFSLAGQALPAQETHFAQFYNFKNALNPAYVSVPSGSEFTAGYRRQWGPVQGGLQGAFAGAALAHCKSNFSLGASVAQLSEPTFGYRMSEAALQIGVFAGRTPERFSIHGGIQTSVGERRVDFSRQVFPGQLDPVFGIVRSNAPFVLSNSPDAVRTFDLAFGGLVRGQHDWNRHFATPYTLGIALQHALGSRDISFQHGTAQVSPRFIAHGSVAIPVANPFTQKPVLYMVPMFKTDWQAPLRQTYLGAMLQFQGVYLAILYRDERRTLDSRFTANTDALLLGIGCKLPLGGGELGLHISNDFSLGGLGYGTTGNMPEFCATYSLPNACAFPRRSPRGRTKCYQFAGKGFWSFL